jgi:DNA-directed RNA polymerase alpha subunit
MSVVLWQPRKPDPFRGLHLAPRARKALQREGITTLDELRVVADQIHQFEGIGLKSAQAIRDELARMAQPEERRSGRK